MNEEDVQKIVHQLKDSILEDGGGNPILVRRIPFICQDIRDIRGDLRWMKWIGGGFVTAAGLLALKALGI